MSLDFYLTANRPVEVYSNNITHNLGEMADFVGLYKVLWRPDEIGITHAAQAIPLLEAGIQKLIDEKEEACKLNPSNGWGNYYGLLKFAQETLMACKADPDAEVRVSR